jgi:hypothetical protein
MEETPKSVLDCNKLLPDEWKIYCIYHNNELSKLAHYTCFDNLPNWIYSLTYDNQNFYMSSAEFRFDTFRCKIGIFEVAEIFFRY